MKLEYREKFLEYENSGWVGYCNEIIFRVTDKKERFRPSIMFQTILNLMSDADHQEKSSGKNEKLQNSEAKPTSTNNTIHLRHGSELDLE